MSDYIKLSSSMEIRKWMDAHPPMWKPLQGLTISEIIDWEEDEKKEVPKDGEYYGVMHSYDGPNLSLRQVFIAQNAIDALRQYIYNHQLHQCGVGEDCIGFKIRDNFWYEGQEIEVFKLAEGTDHFW
ncbi:MAG: hypothetical protein JW762_04435 [Dehalococcoidales bacterium]|nr:hypothetical protein [Dehalococcoidales bacterium]